MTIKSRIPTDIKDDRAMRPFLDRLDRTHIKVGEVNDPSGSTTFAEIDAKIAEILKYFRAK